MTKFVVAMLALLAILSWGVVSQPDDCLADASTNPVVSKFNGSNLFDKISGLKGAQDGCRFDNPGLCGAIARPSAGPGGCPFTSSELCDRIGSVSTFDGPFTYDKSRVGARGASSAGGTTCFPCFRPFHP